ncbi:hypothetical protein DL240_06690 [Lujinxingia litoralis]|uniref:Ketoreductase domain-containing protein n=1 Tax=Lujinxingia litoralis TaxID=2211119 RepID=A0A328CA21_9DELT|nr:SDR family NAD(P)-dependent oxidoreductase [Lujinxingia litoralis]RAL23834.1 hypothetical protein DL240_06690 [Lujinxingia litoralis]
MGAFDGKVALVTGAGQGLGRAYALALASAGAKVVVNDPGCEPRDDALVSLAEEVVAEIRALGGEAVADRGSVAWRADAQAMVARAVECFGRLDVLINNAGVLRDKTLVRMKEQMWDQVLDVHLKGTFLVTRFAFEQMLRSGRGGRIINTSSYAGLKGNFGQSNYAAAKAGIAGLTRTVALEGARYNITCNAIAPLAKTRMSQALAEVPESFRAEDVAPLVLWLASEESAGVTGRVFGAHGRHYFEYVVETTPGVAREEPWTLEEVGAHFEAITARPRSVIGRGGCEDVAREEAREGIVGQASPHAQGPREAAVGKTFEMPARRLTAPEMIAYAEAVHERQPRYLSEEVEGGLVAAPLFAVQPLFSGLEAVLADEELAVDLLRLVHGEQEMIFYDVLRPGDLVVPRAEIASVEEKSSGWLVQVRQHLMREGEAVVEAVSTLFVRKRSPGAPAPQSEAKRAAPKNSPAEPAPDVPEVIFSQEEVVAEDQPRRYAAASGDHNAIHLDASVAKAAGLPDVILHGLCTMAFAARAAVDGVAQGRVERLRRIKVRFARPVFRGERLSTQIREREPGRFLLETLNEKGQPVLSHGEVEIG